MKQLFLKLALFIGLVVFSVSVFAQGKPVVVKAGTFVDLQSIKTVYASEVGVGDLVRFRVVSDVKSDGKVVIPAGIMADGIVTEAKKSSLAGTKGKLSIDIKSLTLIDGTKIPLSGSVRVSGKNRTPLAVITGCILWPCIFIPGTKAVMPVGYNVSAIVFANTEITID